MALSSLIRKVPGLGDVDEDRDKEIVEDLDRLFEQAKNDRMQYEGQWLVNLAFFLSQQWVVFDSATKRLRPIRSMDRKQVRMVINLIRQQVLTKYAKLTQTRPESHAQPASDDVDDKQQAEVCDAILEYLRSIDGSEGAEMRAMMWALVTGTGIFEVAWNKAAGTMLYQPDTTLVTSIDPATGQESTAEAPHPKAGQPLVDKNGDPVHLGEVETREVSPFEFYPDPFGVTMEKKSWVFIQTLRSPEYIMERYGVKVEARDVSGDTFVDGQLTAISGLGGAQPKKGVMERRFIQRPTKQYPEGRYVVYVDQKVLEQGPNPYPKATLAFATFVDIPVPGRFWGDSTITDMIDPQRNLNKTRSQAIEIRNALKPKYFVVKGALLPGQEITNAPDEIVEYEERPNTPEGGRPYLSQGATVPESMWKDAERSTAEIRDVSGVHEVSNSSTPSGVTAARAIGFLQEQDDLRLGPTAKEYERAIGERDEYKLRLGRQFYDEPRTARIVGPNNAVKVVQFYKEDIPDDVDVRVVAGSALPKSRVARQNLLVSLYKMGVFKEDPNEFLRLMEIGDIEGLYKRVTVDVNQAERENERLKRGESIAPAHRGDNHPVHVGVHNEMRKGEEWETASAEQPVLVEVLEQHLASHEQYATAQAQPAAPSAGQAPAPDAGGMDLAALAGSSAGPAEGNPQAFTTQ